MKTAQNGTNMASSSINNDNVTALQNDNNILTQFPEDHNSRRVITNIISSVIPLIA